VWSKAFGVTGSTSSVQSLAVDASGNVYVLGNFDGGVNCGGGQINSVGQGQDIFVAKLDPSGNQLWVQSFGVGTNDILAGSMALAGGNGVVLAGTYSNSVTFGGAALTPPAGATQGAFVVELAAADGSQVWSKGLPQTTSLFAAADGGGNVVIAGAFSGTVDVGGGSLVSAGGDDILVARFDGSGNLQWSKRIGGAGNDEVTAVAVDGNGGVLLGGSTSAGISFGGGVVAGGNDYAIKLGQDGSIVFGQGVSGGRIQSVAVNGNGDSLVAGSATGSVSVGGAQIAAATSGYDFLVLELDSSGNLVSDKRAGNGAGLGVNQIAANASGEVAVVAASRAGSVDMGTGSTLGCSAACLLVARLSM
jgi:hypothetical protein